MEFNDDQNKIVIEGPPEEVAVVEEKIKEQKNELVIIPAKAFARDYVITGVSLSVCLFVTTITK